ncbi:MAG: cell division protein ZipA [Shewanella sp.]|nr:cell division protein ZipA [Shewanella sp.]MCF1431036.1 cell division protein ZipA [Shewanella sp.]MCF1439381.1 cell division protein ZipA [Shewanella sp.]MCF1457993.1 cell division protein ZipA [Shewanella sp.]
MENFQLVLSVLGGLAILAVAVHGLWSVRKQQPKPLRNGSIPRVSKDSGGMHGKEGYDADDEDQMRVVNKDKPRIEVPEAPGHQCDPVMSAGHKPVPGLAEEPQVVAAPVKTPLGEQTSLFTETELEQQASAPAQIQPETPVAEATEPETQQERALNEPLDVLVLHVCAREGEELAGAELLPCLLTLNFKFGEMNIFHRHEDNAGTGKVLFSMANMVKPGVFDPDSMEQFTTQGVALFMTLPGHGDSLRNFSIMLNSAFQLADDLGAEVLDDRRQPWHNDTKQAYLERIQAAGL